MDNGPVSTWDFETMGEDYDYVDSEFFKKYFEPYINYTEKYGHNNSNVRRGTVKNIDGKTLFELKWVSLNDGTSIALYSNMAPKSLYVWLFVDINNSNQPNRLGKDIFFLDIYKQKKVIFWHSDMVTYGCKKGTGALYSGGNCGYEIQTNGWAIPDGYPW